MQIGVPVSEGQASTLEDRYGTGNRRRFDRRLAWIVGSVALVLGVAFLVTVSVRTTNPVEVQAISSGPMSDFEFEAKFTVSAPPHSNVACAVEALSPSKAIVGWKIIELPFGPERTQNITARLLTTTPATVAHARDCWVVEDE